MDVYRWVFKRYYEYDAGKEPAILLNDTQREGIERVLKKIRKGYYTLEEASCICGEKDNSILIAQKDRYGFPVESRLCLRCGILRTSPRFSSESLVRC
jgi:hypothetical protein